MGGRVSTDFKWNWNILICSSVIEFLLILGVLPFGWDWVDGGGGVCVRGPPMHAYMHAHTHVHTHTHTHMHVKHDKHGCLHVGDHLQFLYMYTCACMHAHACACVWGHPYVTRHPPTHPPPPQSHRDPKTPKFNKSWTNQDISILFEESLPLNPSELI